MLIKERFNLVVRATGIVLLALLAVMGVNGLAVADGLTPYYAQTDWPTLHRDSMNSDYVPFAGPDSLATNWTALDRQSVLTAVTIGPEGNLYVTTGTGSGKKEHLYAFDRYGDLIWVTKLLDYKAIVSSATVDVDGDIYLSDSDQLFSFHSDGTLKWSIPISDCVYTPVITVDGYLVAVTRDGKVMALYRNDGSLAAPILELIGVGISSSAAPVGLWSPDGDEMVAAEIIQSTYDTLSGTIYKVTNTPAVNPINNRIYIVAGGPVQQQGYFYGIDFTPPVTAGALGSLDIAFQTLMGAGSRTSPAISSDGSHIYVAERNTTIYAFNTDGSLAWSYNDPLGGEIHGSPSISPDGMVYDIIGGSICAIKDMGTSADFRWANNFSSLGAQYGYPVSTANSIVSVATNYLYASASFGYLFSHEGKDYFIPHLNVVCVMNPDDGSIIGDPIEVRDVSEGILSVANDGSIYMGHGSTSSSIAYSLNRFMPRYMRIPRPLGGVTALQPTSPLTLARSRTRAAQESVQKALSSMKVGKLEDAVSQTSQGIEQLLATPIAIDDAETRGEIDLNVAAQAQQHIKTAYKICNKVKKHLKDDLTTAPAATEEFEKAGKELKKALALMTIM